MEITRCPYAEKCIWIGQTVLGGTLRKTNIYFNKNETQHICERLHPGESVRDLLLRIGVHIHDEDY